MLELLHDDFEGVCLLGLHSESPIMQLAPGYTRRSSQACAIDAVSLTTFLDCDDPKSQQEINKTPHHT